MLGLGLGSVLASVALGGQCWGWGSVLGLGLGSVLGLGLESVLGLGLVQRTLPAHETGSRCRATALCVGSSPPRAM